MSTLRLIRSITPSSGTAHLFNVEPIVGADGPGACPFQRIEPDEGQAADPTAFAASVASQRERLIRTAMVMTRDRTRAEDLVQDTMERALKRGHQFKPGTNLGAWLKKMMHNLFADRCRTKSVYVTLDPDALVDLPASEEPSEPAEIDYADVFTAADVESALEEINPPMREIFRLAYSEKKTYEAIATALKIPSSTVGTRLWRARSKVRQVLSARMREHARAC